MELKVGEDPCLFRVCVFSRGVLGPQGLGGGALQGGLPSPDTHKEVSTQGPAHPASAGLLAPGTQCAGGQLLGHAHCELLSLPGTALPPPPHPLPVLSGASLDL